MCSRRSSSTNIKFIFSVLQQNPDDPSADFQSPPGQLGFNCLTTFLRDPNSILKEMLLYNPKPLLLSHPSSLSISSRISSNSRLRSALLARGELTLRHVKSALTGRERVTPTSTGGKSDSQTLECNGDAGRPRDSSNRRLSSSAAIDDCDLATSAERMNGTTDRRPLFPVVEVANALVSVLCELFHINGKLISTPSV